MNSLTQGRLLNNRCAQILTFLFKITSKKVFLFSQPPEIKFCFKLPLETCLRCMLALLILETRRTYEELIDVAQLDYFDALVCQCFVQYRLLMIDLFFFSKTNAETEFFVAIFLPFTFLMHLAYTDFHLSLCSMMMQFFTHHLQGFLVGPKLQPRQMLKQSLSCKHLLSIMIIALMFFIRQSEEEISIKSSSYQILVYISTVLFFLFSCP